MTDDIDLVWFAVLNGSQDLREQVLGSMREFRCVVLEVENE